mmetsp:Transcript_68147/g.133680  ORF Transcript_68147/g.133680 Transcript_68147/m.133680 type:complete len:367 (+) Transcript_68147:109-1209(+)
MPSATGSTGSKKNTASFSPLSCRTTVSSLLLTAVSSCLGFGGGGGTALFRAPFTPPSNSSASLDGAFRLRPSAAAALLDDAWKPAFLGMDVGGALLGSFWAGSDECRPRGEGLATPSAPSTTVAHPRPLPCCSSGGAGVKDVYVRKISTAYVATAPPPLLWRRGVLRVAVPCMEKDPNSLEPFADTVYFPTESSPFASWEGWKVSGMPPSLTFFDLPPNFMLNPPEYTPLSGGGSVAAANSKVFTLRARNVCDALPPGSSVYSNGETRDLLLVFLAESDSEGDDDDETASKSAALMAHCPLIATTPPALVSVPRIHGISAFARAVAAAAAAAAAVASAVAAAGGASTGVGTGTALRGSLEATASSS